MLQSQLNTLNLSDRLKASELEAGLELVTEAKLKLDSILDVRWRHMAVWSMGCSLLHVMCHAYSCLARRPAMIPLRRLK
jgi:hypothetical protein